MSDLIEREAALNCFHSWVDKYGDVYTPDDNPEYRAIEALPSVQPEQRWIPCSERMPEEGERVLATHLGGVNPNNQVIEHIYQHGEFTCGWDMDMNVDSPTFGQRYMGEVIAWMPSPKPYREDNHETD